MITAIYLAAMLAVWCGGVWAGVKIGDHTNSRAINAMIAAIREARRAGLLTIETEIQVLRDAQRRLSGRR